MEDYSNDPRYINARANFQELILTSELSRESILRGWELFLQSERVKNSIIRKGAAAGMANVHVIHILNDLKGEGIQRGGIDTTTASLGHFDFELSTYSPIGSEIGFLLEGIEEERLESAISFCKGMDEVGWRTGDFDEKYPQTSA